MRLPGMSAFLSLQQAVCTTERPTSCSRPVDWLQRRPSGFHPGTSQTHRRADPPESPARRSGLRHRRHPPAVPRHCLPRSPRTTASSPPKLQQIGSHSQRKGSRSACRPGSTQAPQWRRSLMSASSIRSPSTRHTPAPIHYRPCRSSPGKQATLHQETRPDLRCHILIYPLRPPGASPLRPFQE